MYLYNEFIINILNDLDTLSCPSKNNSNTIKLTVHTSGYWGLRLTLCYYRAHSLLFGSQTYSVLEIIRKNFNQRERENEKSTKNIEE